MTFNQQHVPLFQKLVDFSKQKPISFYVPGHKNGNILPKMANEYFSSILPLDLTELNGLDDLHSPQGVIAEAEQLAADFFQAEHTFFLVGGSTVGNLAMILATCSEGEKIIVQRNSHKSILNGLELCGARPIYVTPEYDASVSRYTAPSFQTMKQAIQAHPEAKAVVLTYPDYFGITYDIKKIIDLSHQHSIPVLVDEAHGVHFSIGEPFPSSALELGADIVVQSAHKMAPAMTMASFLHVKSNFISKEQISHYLQILQSSSPSYPLLASLDIARYFLANITAEDKRLMVKSTEQVKEILKKGKYWSVMSGNDPLKITLQMDDSFTGFEMVYHLEEQGIFPELATNNQVLLIHGLQKMDEIKKLETVIKTMNEQLKSDEKHATIDISKLFTQSIQSLSINLKAINQLPTKEIPLSEAEGKIAAEAIIPYPPGIPLVAKGETITITHVEVIQLLIEQGAKFQHRHIEKGIHVLQMT